MARVVKVEVISDIVCPWCWVGKRSIELAAKEAKVDLELHWKPYQLNPGCPKEGMDKMEAYKMKFGPGIETMMRDPDNMLNRRGRPMGIEFNYVEGCQVFNTFDPHRAMYWARTVSPAMQNNLQEVLFRKYFKECRNLGDARELRAACVEAGLPEAEVDTFLRSDKYAKETQKELQAARAIVTGVPHFTFPTGNYVSGGEAIEVFKAHLEACAARM